MKPEKSLLQPINGLADHNLCNKEVSARVDAALLELAESLQLSDSVYESANRAYQSVADWLVRPNSVLIDESPSASLQGSFRHGTAIKSINEDDHHDVDMVCQCKLAKASITQSQLKGLLGEEIDAYARRFGMSNPEEGNRCWTLQYADSAHFHLDCLPAIPDSDAGRAIRNEHLFDQSHVESTLAITDRRHPEYSVHTNNWLQSNPEGYASWFQSQMALAFDSRREALALAEHTGIDSIPYYRIRTPLQVAIQILKRHRDIYFSSDLEIKPISVIITTLSAHAYNNETRLPAALINIVDQMLDFIELRNGVDWIGNPSHPIENFADKWAIDDRLRKAFYEWHEAVSTDIAQLLDLTTQSEIDEFISERFGSRIAKEINEKRDSAIPGQKRLFDRLTPKHRQSPPWDFKRIGYVKISEVTSTANVKGPRSRSYRDGGAALPKGTGLRFKAKSNVPRPFRVYWQVVNWGSEASRRGGLRGGFDDGGVNGGNLTNRETAEYSGTHTIECFIVKENYLVARSGRFEVNVR